MLSMKAKYAIRALVVMAKNNKQILTTKIIANSAGIPQKFLEAILLELKHNNILESKRGIFGGYFFLKPPTEVTIGNLLRIIDGPLAPIRCASLTAYQKCDDCIDEKKCEIRNTMMEVRRAISNILDNKSIADMALGHEQILS